MKDITVVDVNEGDKQVEREAFALLREPVEEKPEETTEEKTEEKTEEPKVEVHEITEAPKLKKEYTTRQVNIERDVCPDCKVEMSKNS